MNDLAALKKVLQTPLRSGRLKATASFDTRPGSASANIVIDGQDLGFESAITTESTLGLAASADWNGRVVRADAAISGRFGDPVSARGSVALRPTGGALPEIPPNGALDAEIAWSGDIGNLWALVPLPDHVLDGQLDLDLLVSGTIANPRLGGSIGLSGGEYQNLETGTILTDLSLTSKIDPSGSVILDLTGNDGNSGKVTATARVDAETIDLTLGARQAVLVRRDDVGAQMTVDLTVKGPLSTPEVKGDVLIERAEVRLVNALPPSVADLGPVRIKGAPEAPPDNGGAGKDVALDIRISAPGKVFVRGRGLDSEWNVDMAITGSAAEPVVKGDIEKLRGALNFLGKDFDLEKGSISFSGESPPDPTLDIALAHENKDGLVGRIRVTGHASEFEIGFSSEPELPESEVLPQTLFGKSRQSLSPTEAVLLANGLALLIDGSGGAVDRIRSTVGIDVLRLEESDDSVAVSVGKNVTDDIYVGAKQPIGGGSATIEVEVQVYKGVTVDAETSEDKGSAIGFSWRRNF